MIICGCVLRTGQCWGSGTWEVCGLAVQHVEPGEEVADVWALMEQQGLLRKIVDNRHAKNTDRCAKIFDVESSGKRFLKLLGPFWITAEYQEVININCDEDYQRRSDQSVAGAVAFQPFQPV